MPTLSDDDPEKWTYEEHTRAKHEVLSYYFEVWTKIVSTEERTLQVFDCFAGRGNYEEGDANPFQLSNINSEAEYPGSPLILIDELAGLNHLFDKANCYFIEPMSNNRSTLKTTLNETDGIPENVDYEVFDAKFEDDISDIIREAAAWRDFGFFFIDPFGLKPLDYEQVTTVAATPGFDCIITLMTKELIRWQESETHEKAFETLYGTEEWKTELSEFKPEHLETAEAEYYCSKLEEGGVEFPLAYMTTRGDSRELMYDLVFTTNDGKGLEAMKGSLARCGTEYTLAFAPQRTDITEEEQATLAPGGVMTEEKKAKSYLLTRFAGESYEFGELVQTIFRDPERRYARPIKRDYRNYLKELDDEGEINIPDRGSPNDPLPDDYTVSFPEL